MLLNSITSVTKLQETFKPFFPGYSFFTTSDFLICKRILCKPSLRQTPEWGWGKLFFLQPSSSWGLAKSEITKNITGVWQVCFLPCKEDGAKSFSCKASKTWRSFCFDPSLPLAKDLSFVTNHKELFPLPPLPKYFLTCSC